MRIVLLAPLLAVAAPAAALPLFPPVTVAATGGTLGVGSEITYRFNRLVAVRGSATFLGVSGHGRVSDYRYEGHLRLRNVGGTVDVHPIPLLGFRLSAGARATAGNRVRFFGDPRGPRTFGGVAYAPDQAGSIRGEIRTRDVSPILTAGYVFSGLTGITFGIDGGVMFQGHPQVRDLSYTGQLAANPLAQAERDRQAQRLRDKVSGYPYYPVVQLSLGYRF